MARRHYLRTALAGTLALALTVPVATASYAEGSAASASAASEKASKGAELVQKAQYTIEHFGKGEEVAWVRRNIGRVKGVMIIPQEVKGGFIFGGSGGNGVLLAHDAGGWSAPAFYTLGSATFGLQAGAEVSEIVLLIMTDKGLRAFESPEVKLGGEVSVSAGPVGAGAEAQTTDIIAFSRSKGLYGGLNLEGAVITPRDAWNEAYYGKAVTPADVIEGRVAPDKARELRAALADFGTGTPDDATGTVDESQPAAPMTSPDMKN